MAALLSRWWRTPSHYYWFSGYLRERGIDGATRMLLASTSVALALCLVALLSSADGPRGAGPVAMTWTAFAGGVAGVVLWSTRWPTYAQSVGYALVTNTSMALACLAHPNPMAALIGCVAFATSGAYVAFFHSPAFVVYNFTVAAGVALFEAIRLGSHGHAALAGVDLFLVLQVNIALPLAIQILIRALGRDLVRAGLDPLTGLCNRRAFQQQLSERVTARPAHHGFLLLAVVDLDDFKALNDRAGHSAGDRALVEVARALRTSASDSAVIARSGGEEFIVADTCDTGDPTPLAKRICHTIDELPIQITASVGTTHARLDGVLDTEHQLLVERLIGIADNAMYLAKRNGGNGFHDHGCAD